MVVYSVRICKPCVLPHPNPPTKIVFLKSEDYLATAPILTPFVIPLPLQERQTYLPPLPDSLAQRSASSPRPEASQPHSPASGPPHQAEISLPVLPSNHLSVSWLLALE